MYARAVEQADSRLRELRHDELGRLAVAGVSLSASLITTQFQQSLAAPLFVGGLVVGALGVRAMWRRWDLLERLSGERDAHVIPEVRAFASREATMDRRQSYAALIRGALRNATFATDARILAVADDLGALASELEDADLALEPAAAVACMRLLNDMPGSPLLNPALPAEDLRSRVRQIRAGFTPRGQATTGFAFTPDPGGRGARA